jgi:hypothetical protein
VTYSISAGTLDRHGRLAEDGAAAMQLLHQVPGVGRQVVAVVAGDAVAAERFRQPFDAVPVELEAGAHHQLLVLDHPAAIEDDRVALGFEGRHRRLDPVHAARQHAGHRAGGGGRVEDTRTHQRPTGLVVVDVRRVDDGDVQARTACQQAGRHRDPRGAAADDDDLVGGVGHVHRRLATIDDAAHHALQVEACLRRALDDLRQGQLPGLRQGPHGGRPHAGAAVGQHRLGQLGHQRPEGRTLFVGHLARLGRQVAALQPVLTGRALDLVEIGLVGTFAVWPVADDRLEAGVEHGPQVQGHDLRGDRQFAGEGSDVHAVVSVPVMKREGRSDGGLLQRRTR